MRAPAARGLLRIVCAACKRARASISKLKRQGGNQLSRPLQPCLVFLGVIGSFTTARHRRSVAARTHLRARCERSSEAAGTLVRSGTRE